MTKAEVLTADDGAQLLWPSENHQLNVRTQQEANLGSGISTRSCKSGAGDRGSSFPLCNRRADDKPRVATGEKWCDVRSVNIISCNVHPGSNTTKLSLPQAYIAIEQRDHVEGAIFALRSASILAFHEATSGLKLGSILLLNAKLRVLSL